MSQYLIDLFMFEDSSDKTLKNVSVRFHIDIT